jgi:DNA polymerase-3 subunit chi
MTEILFYHLERRGLDDVLPGLIEKTLERGWRALIRVESAERADAIDTLLWTYNDGFLPHAQAGDASRC